VDKQNKIQQNKVKVKVKAKAKKDILSKVQTVFPKDQYLFEKIKRVVQKQAEAFNFKRIDTGILEFPEIYEKFNCKSSQELKKEPLVFSGKKRKKIALKHNHNLSILNKISKINLKKWRKPIKLYTLGPIFAYLNKQESYEQNNELSFQVVKREDPIIDAQLINICTIILNKLGIRKKLLVYLNLMGCSECQKNYLRNLKKFLKNKNQEICKDCKKAVKKEPFTFFICNDHKCKDLIRQSPKMIDFGCEACMKHFKTFLSLLEVLKIDYEVNPYLFRFPSYHSKFYFEIKTKNENQILASGGRFDDLIKSKDKNQKFPSIGFRMNFATLIQEMAKYKENDKPVSNKKKIFLINLGELAKKKMLKLYFDLINQGFKVSESFGKSSIKSQLNSAKKVDADIALIIGQKEALDNSIIVRSLKSGSQETILEDKLVDHIKKIS
jgi:histidyl-tRNA synthetase